jgi:hypothetical protein
VEETIAELQSDLLSDIPDLELSNAEMVGSILPTTSVWKLSQSRLGDGIDSEHSSTDISDSEVSEHSDTERVDGWSKSGKTPNLEPFLGNPSVCVDIGDHSDITQVVSSLI